MLSWIDFFASSMASFSFPARRYHPRLVESNVGAEAASGMALDAALACPDRRVIAFEANGSGLYTVQALWSMARESAGRERRGLRKTLLPYPLQTELARAGITLSGHKTRALTDLTRPVIDWVALARGFGLPACKVGRDGERPGALNRTLAAREPGLIEAVIGLWLRGGGTQLRKPREAFIKNLYDGRGALLTLGSIKGHEIQGTHRRL